MDVRLYLSVDIPDDTFYATVQVAMGWWEGSKQVAVAGLYKGPIVADPPREDENLLGWVVTNLANAYDAAHPALVKAFADNAVYVIEPVAQQQET